MHLFRDHIVCTDSELGQNHLAWASNVLTVSMCMTLQCAISQNVPVCNISRDQCVMHAAASHFCKRVMHSFSTRWLEAVAQRQSSELLYRLPPRLLLSLWNTTDCLQSSLCSTGIYTMQTRVFNVPPCPAHT